MLHMLRALLVALLAPAGLLLVWLALSTSAPRADFVVACDELRTIDPQRVSWLDEIQLTQSLFEGLTRPDPQTLKPEPAAAEGWEISPDFRRFVFHLRAGLRWSNGAPLIADHFRYAWLRALRPDSEAQYANLLFVIAGAEGYYRAQIDSAPGNDRSAPDVGVRAVDERTLVIELARPCPYLLEILSLPIFAPLYPPALERFADATGRIPTAARHLWTRPGALVCNGPFVLKSWEFKRGLRLERNPYHREADGDGVKSIEILIIGNPNAALLAYQTGRVDLVRTLDPDVARTLRARAPPPPDYHEGDRYATYFLRVNCRRPPLENAELRRALSLAIDREALCRHVLGLGETPAYTLAPPLHDARPHPPTGDRIAEARAALARSGFDPRSRALRLACAHDPPQQRRINESIQRMWEETLGVTVELEVQERKVLSERIRNLDYDLARSDWFGDYIDPGTFLDLFVSDSAQNRTGWSNTEYDALVRSAANEVDQSRRLAAYQKADDILCDDENPIIPLFHRTGQILLSPRIDGIHDNPLDVLPLYRARRR